MNTLMSMMDEITCPVCRARQEPNAQCRRCNADLQLYLKCLHSQRIASQEYMQAQATGDLHAQAEYRQYLHWLTGSPPLDTRP